MRPIDADALKQNHCGACANKEFCAEESCQYYEFRRRIETSPTIPEIDRSAILRLCNEIEDLASDIGKHTMMETVYAEARMIFDKAKEIGKELTGDAAD